MVSVSGENWRQYLLRSLGGRLDLWIFCMMDERSNICLFLFFSFHLLLPFFVFVVHIGVSFVPGSCRVYSIGRKTRSH